VSRENSVTFAGDQLNEAGTAAQTRAALMEANRLSFFMIFSQLMTTNKQTSYVPGSLDLNQLNILVRTARDLMNTRSDEVKFQ
jgi:hypothetical protein